jgi:hypothetical protein
MEETPDLKALGLVGQETAAEAPAAEQSDTTAPGPDMEPQVGPEAEMILKLENALNTLLFAVDTFNQRIGQLELWLVYLLSKDPYMGPRVAEMAAKTGGKAQLPLIEQKSAEVHPEALAILNNRFGAKGSDDEGSEA